MSLIRIAARMSAVEALKGRTLVGDNVLDSEIGSFNYGADGQLSTEEDRPFIAVYTGASESGAAPVRSLFVNGSTDFLFETAIATPMTTIDPATDLAVIQPGIPVTDHNFEFYLDTISRQIDDALTDPTNEWGELFRSLTTGFKAVRRERTSSSGSGVRLAGQQIVVKADLLADPGRGALLPTHPLARFFEKAVTLNDPQVTTKIAMMQEQLSGVFTDFQTMQQRFGRTNAEARATGLEVVGAPIAASVVV